jgi:hypothetical protein
MDAWQAMFEIAERGRPEGASDIVPYWVYTIAGGAQIERHVLAHALSSDVVRLHALLKSLTSYRVAFGQARQDDFIRYLQDRVPESDWTRIAALAAIDISPTARRGMNCYLRSETRPGSDLRAVEMDACLETSTP